MRWNQLADDMPRALALADIMCGAALADGNFDVSERIVALAMLMKVLGVTQLPAEVEAHVNAFDRGRFNLAAAIKRLDLESDKEKRSLLKVVADIVKADTKVEKTERTFVTRLGKVLGIPANEMQSLLD